jgi:hypothetical protein
VISILSIVILFRTPDKLVSGSPGSDAPAT